MTPKSPDQLAVERWIVASREALGLGDLDVRVYFDLPSGIPDHRRRVRSRLAEAVQTAAPGVQNISDLLIPGTRGPLSGIHFSVSHCPLASGFALSRTPLGFDLEDSRRVHLKLNARVRHPKDATLASSSVGFWSAKESAFKAFSLDQSSTLSQIAISSWDETSEGHWLFDASTEGVSGRGIVTRIQTLTLSIFTKEASFSR